MKYTLGRRLGRMASLMVAAGIVIYGGSAVAGVTEDYEQGHKRYVSGDVVSAMPLLRRAADAGNAAAQALMGDILDHADSDEEAVQFYRKSAAQNNAEGQFGLGVMLAGGQGTPKNLSEARKWISLAAEQGHKLAINELATAYIKGGLDIPDEARKGSEALRWIQAAAENNYIPAMEALAGGYRDGSYGLTVDSKLAEQWTEKVRKVSGVREKSGTKKRS